MEGGGVDIRGDEINMKVDLKGHLGIGGEASLDVTIKPQEIKEDAQHVGHAVTEGVTHVGHRIGHRFGGWFH